MTDWRTIVGTSETLSAADLEGHRPTLEIVGVSGGRFEEDGETGAAKKVDKKALIEFKGKTKKLAANTINCLLLEKMWGRDFEGWAGHRVTIGEDTVEVRGKFFGEPCIRVMGSPELSETLTVEIKLPRRRPIQRTLVPTGAAASDEGGAGA